MFELDQFFPPNDRTTLAMKLNGLLASPSFACVGRRPATRHRVDCCYTPDGKPRCAIVTTAHLSDEERQFVTSLVLSKLVTWMRRQSGITDLRALLYMDEVAGYLPPTANPPTKKPIMTLMKQARAFGVGVVLATQNPVDIDYKAISNAGTWMVGRLQTERDKQRLLDGMSAALRAGSTSAPSSDTISGLGKREFVLRRAGKDTPEVFTTRWAMSYLRGPLTRDQISTLIGGSAGHARPPPPATRLRSGSARRTPHAVAGGARSSRARWRRRRRPVMPDVAGGVAVRWVDPAAPWLARSAATHRHDGERGRRRPGRRCATTRPRPTSCTTRSTRRSSIPLGDQVDVARRVAVDYDDRDLRDADPDGMRRTGFATHHSDEVGFWTTSSATSPTISPAACRWSCRATRR